MSDINDFVSPSEFLKTQANDKTLNSIRNHVQSEKVFNAKGRISTFILKKRRLCRELTFKGVTKLQFILPKNFRRQVFQLGHEGIMGGHMSYKKTLDRIKVQFSGQGWFRMLIDGAGHAITAKGQSLRDQSDQGN